jgi:hypothetical protein
MSVESTLGYYNTVTITAVKCFVVQAPREDKIANFCKFYKALFSLSLIMLRASKLGCANIKPGWK